LSPYQIEVLDDLQFEGATIIPKEQPKNSYCDQLKSLKLQVFTPYNQFIVVWDLFQILTYLMIFFWLPYKISFEIYFIEDLLQIGSGDFFEIMFLFILASDVLVGCNLAFIHKGQIQKDRKRIVIHYFKQYAFVDLVIHIFHIRKGIPNHHFHSVLHSQPQRQRPKHARTPNLPLRCLLRTQNHKNQQNPSTNTRVSLKN